MRALAVTLLVACGGGGEKRPDPPSNKPIPESKLADSVKLGDVAEADQEALCDQLYALKQPEMVMQATCYFTAMEASAGNTDGELRACAAAHGENMASLVRSGPCGALTVGNKNGDRVAAIYSMVKSPICEEVLSACAVSPEGDADFVERAVEPAEKFTAQGCACADKACAIKVDDEFRLWDATLELPSRAKPSPETDKRLKATLAAYRVCLGKLAPERNTR